MRFVVCCHPRGPPLTYHGSGCVGSEVGAGEGSEGVAEEDGETDEGDIGRQTGTHVAHRLCDVRRRVLSRLCDQGLDVAGGTQRVGEDPALAGLGVESLTIAFPDVPYAGHLEEPGYNGVFFEGAPDMEKFRTLTSTVRLPTTRL